MLKKFSFFVFFLVATLTEKQKRLQEVESIKEDASTNYVSFQIFMNDSQTLGAFYWKSMDLIGSPITAVLQSVYNTTYPHFL